MTLKEIRRIIGCVLLFAFALVFLIVVINVYLWHTGRIADVCFLCDPYMPGVITYAEQTATAGQQVINATETARFTTLTPR